MRLITAFAIVVLSAVSVNATAGDVDAALVALDRGDYARAIRLLRPAARQGDATAQYYLGSMLLAGKGVPLDKKEAAVWFRRAAEQAHSLSQYNLGVMYSLGEGVPQDLQEAVRWLSKAADQAVPDAQNNLCVAYVQGRGVAQDASVGAEWCRRAAHQGHPGAQFNLGLAYEGGVGVQRDPSQAAVWYRKAAEQGNAGAQAALGRMYREGDGVARDPESAYLWLWLAASQGDSESKESLAAVAQELRPEQLKSVQTAAASWKSTAAVGVKVVTPSSTSTSAQTNERKQRTNRSLEAGLKAYESGDYATSMKLLLPLAEEGEITAQYAVATMLRNGKGTKKDPERAVHWYRQAAERGDPYAQGMLGHCYAAGEGVLEDPVQAAYWYRRSAEQGLAIYQHKLALMLLRGRGVQKDTAQAVEWLRRSADQDWAPAQYDLGVSYENGESLPKDSRQAAYWYRKAAEQGNANAQNNLGALYGRGDGVPKDDVQAVLWFRKAAELGLARAQFNLGNRYYYGSGVPKDAQQAYFWWLLASAQGHDKALSNRDAVEAELTPAQRAAAQSSAREWQPRASSSDTRPDDFVPGKRRQQMDRAHSTSKTPDSAGSGVRVSNNRILTNHHVVRECSHLAVNGELTESISSDPRVDLALLRDPGSAGAAAVLRAGRLSLGEAVTVSGFPLQGLLTGLNITTGNISGLTGLQGDTRYVQVSAPVQPGNSGGPLLDSAGRLAGIVVSKLDAVRVAKLTGDIPQNVNFAINVHTVRSFLDAHGVTYLSSSSEAAIPSARIADRARAFTVRVECWK